MKLCFAGIDPYIETHKVIPEEKVVGKIIKWGVDNKYPVYLDDLYKNVPTLKSVIDTCVDYTSGESVESQSIMDIDELHEVIKEIALSYYKYGGFALNVLRNRMGLVSRICVMDFRALRLANDKLTIFYNPDFATKERMRNIDKAKRLPLFNPEDKTQYSSVLYYKNNKYANYPTPIYEAAITSCEIEKSIDDYHLNNINNGFMGSVVVNLNNGTPDDEMKKEIEHMFTEKFTGKENAGRVVIAFNDDKEHAATIEKIDTEDFSERYNTLATRSRQNIFTAFRCTPTLCGIPTDNNGFSAEEYDQQYSLFYNTVIRPVQKLIVNKLKYVLNADLVIEPFKIDFNNTKNIKDVE